MLQIESITYQYPDQATPAVSKVSLTINKGEIVAIVGESGSGKSTFLKLLYGMMDLDSGHIFLEDKPILGPKYNLIPGDEAMKYLAQSLDLVTYASVYDNVGTFISNIDIAFKRKRVHTILEAVGLLNFKDEIPKNLSGGQQQRVALARAIAKTPKLLILDEPFSNIDNILKLELRDNLFELFQKLGIAIVFSTHNLQDALGFADTIVVMKAGEIVQKDSPQQLFQNPKNLYVAQLFGYANSFSPEEALKILNIQTETRLFKFPEQLKIQDITCDFQLLKKIYMGTHHVLKIKIDQKILYLTD